MLYLKGNSLYCVTEDDRRWRSMCSHTQSGNGNDDRLLGMEECKSPFGTYELMIPVDETLSCTEDSSIIDSNCMDLDVSRKIIFSESHRLLKSLVVVH